MTDQTQGRPIEPSGLPETITSYLAAHRDRDAETAIGCFAADATVVDDGRTHRGTGEILAWLNASASEYTYTTELIGAEKVDDAHFVATNHLAGDFPGGTVDLRFRFTIRDGLITELTIAV